MRSALRYALLAFLMSPAACSVGDGEGDLTIDALSIPGCHEGPFDLHPTFFAAQPYRDTLNIRIQNGSDLEELSDGLKVLVTDIGRVRAHLGVPLAVGLPAGVTPPGVPITPDAEPAFVHLNVYLHRTCNEQNPALYGVGGTITFRSIFNGDPNETSSQERLTEAELEVILADPRDQPPGGGPIPEERTSLLRGRFRFHFERGQPAQPFP